MNKTAFVAAAVLACGGVQAQKVSPWYGEVGYTGARYEEPGLEAKTGLVRFVLGYDAHPNLAFEGFVGLGVLEDEVRYGSAARFDFKVQDLFGVFVKPKARLTDALEVHGRIGYAKNRIEASAGGDSYSDSGADLAYGLGLGWRFANDVHATIDYTSYYDKDDITIRGLTVGVGFRF